MAPPSLKDVINTNNDPTLCAVCSKPFLTYSNYSVNACCGKEACNECIKNGKVYDSAADRCSLCQSPRIGRIGLLKKQAKKGHPWAQFFLGHAFNHVNTNVGTHKGVSPDTYEALRWYRKAASRDHGVAACCVAYCYRSGIGCNEDLFQAKKYAEKAWRVYDREANEGLAALLLIAKDFVKIYENAQKDNDRDKHSCKISMEQAGDEAESMLLPLAEAGIAEAQYELGKLNMYRAGSFSNYRSMQLLVSAAAQGNEASACFCVVASSHCLAYPQARFWLRVACKLNKNLAESAVFLECAAMLKALTFFCGGCGKGLDASTRKHCKGCKTSCYCSRACQKVHWNCAEDGHRSDCLKAMELNKLMMQMKNGAKDNAS